MTRHARRLERFMWKNPRRDRLVSVALTALALGCLVAAILVVFEG